MQNTVTKDATRQFDTFLVGTGDREKLFFVEFFLGHREFNRIVATDVWDCIWKFAEWSGMVNPISCQYLGDEVVDKLKSMIDNKAVVMDIFNLMNAHSDCQLHHIFAATKII